MGPHIEKERQIQCRGRFVGETSQVCAAGYCRDGPVCVRMHSLGQIRTLRGIAVGVLFGNRFGDDVESRAHGVTSREMGSVARPGILKPRLLKPGA